MAAKIRLLVESNFDEASDDLKKLGAVSKDEAKRMEAGLKKLNNTTIDNFIQRQRRAAAAVTATSGRVEGLKEATANSSGVFRQ